tara:strand:- start:1504 stop:2124 length:621 start_codon:yes stop_codon:yes gene_type:complete
MSLETDALDSVSLAATNQTIAANALKDAIDIINAGYAATKNTVDTQLNNVDNTSDANKPISTATLLEIANYVRTTNLATVNGLPLDTGLALLIASSPTSLSSELYENRASLRNTPTPQPIEGDALILEFLGLFQFYANLDEPDDDETCFSVTDTDTGLKYGQWILKVPAYEWTEAHEKIEFRALEEWRDDMDESMTLLLAEYNAHH